MKLPVFLLILLLPLLPPTLLPENIAGKYGTAGQEFICLELRADTSFDLTISSCSADNHVTGKYTIDGDKISLSSALQPRMELTYTKGFASEKNRIKIKTNEQLLLSRLTVVVDGKKRRVNKNGELVLEEKPKKIAVNYANIPQTEIILDEQTEKGIQLDLQFENLAAATLKDQVWTYSKKKLTFIDEKGNKVILRKTAQCWFDYMEN